MKKTFLIVNAILIAAVIIGDLFYMNFGGLWLKGLTSFGFVLIGAVNLVCAVKERSENKKFPIIMLIGLTFSMLGDIILGVEFIAGALLFAVGHVSYFVAYCTLMKFRWKDLVPCAAIFAVALLIILVPPVFDFGGILMKLVCVVYALVISCMCGKAVANLIRERSVVTVLLVIGCGLFYFSDMMLLFNVFANAPRITDILCILSYYPAQCMLGFSVYAHVYKEKEKTL